MNREVDYGVLKSKTVNFLRYPLMLMIVCIHVEVQTMMQLNPKPFAVDLFWFTQLLCKVAMPLFFIISGYYFFFSADGGVFDKAKYKAKLKNRIRTLLIPYLFWNFFTWLFLILSLLIAGHPEWIAPNEFTVSNLLDTFVGIGKDFDGMPKNFPLWFIRDLMVLCVLSPLLYKILRNGKYYVLIILFCIFLLPYPDGWNKIFMRFPTALFFFSLGAYFSINKLNMIQFVRQRISVWAGLVTVVLLTVLYYNAGKLPLIDSPTVLKCFRLALIVPVLQLSSYLVEHGKVKAYPEIWNSAFFLFALHPVINKYCVVHWIYPLLSQRSVNFLLLYFVQVFGTALLCFVIAFILRKLIPPFAAFITGGRK